MNHCGWGSSRNFMPAEKLQGAGILAGRRPATSVNMVIATSRVGRTKDALRWGVREIV